MGLLLISAASAVEQNIEVDPAQYYMMNMRQPGGGYGSFGGFGNYGNYGPSMQHKGDFPVFDNGPLNPNKYLDMDDSDFPVDYSLPCSNTCGCQQTCMIIWW